MGENDVVLATSFGPTARGHPPGGGGRFQGLAVSAGQIQKPADLWDSQPALYRRSVCRVQIISATMNLALYLAIESVGCKESLSADQEVIMSSTEPSLDVICIGRSSVDYGGQVGGRLEDMSSFSKYTGGSPTNISVGCTGWGSDRRSSPGSVMNIWAGLSVKRWKREGVDDSHMITDTARLALVILGIRNAESFPLIFYRENCADMAICEDDIDPEFIASGAGCAGYRYAFQHRTGCRRQSQGDAAGP